MQSKTFAPIRWVVPGILPEGVTLLSGKPKMGKSWLALGWCIAVATGGAALGKRRVERGDVAYLALEDNQRRIKSRMNTMMRGETHPNSLHIYTEWPKFNAENMGELRLRHWLEDHPDTRLIVIDTIKKIRPRPSGNQNIYDVDYEAVEPLMYHAEEFNVGILAVHHNNKMTDPTDPFDAVSGSTGLTGGVDTVLILNRERGNASAFLYVDGRDIEEQGKHPLQWDPQVCSWTLADGEAIRYEMSSERRAIFDALPDYGDPVITRKNIVAATGMKDSNVGYLLSNMVKDGQAYSPSRSGYTKPATPPNDTNNPNDANNANYVPENANVSGNMSTPNNSTNEESRMVKGVGANVSDVSGVGDVNPHEAPIPGGCIHNPKPNSEPGGCAECRNALAEQLMMA